MIRFLALALLFATPVVAEDELPACTTWSAQMQEDEGGEVFTASACATDRPDAFMMLTCSAGEVFIRYDLAAGAERSPDLGERAGVDFTIGVNIQRVPMTYQEMDGLFAGTVPAGGPLVTLMRSGDSMTLADGDGRYPIHTFSLRGSSGSLGALLERCF
ncbi:hypothetical protein PRN20_12225 [Devosia sp. ZB163]|uniref:hypothetical protein n=1 Tax=Devosia sp. ZB163 TaxID=3025938 RepID=UPI0023622578|nr:hypothetical protein [Devosia sp. ZB163]MDC9824501.1 hypothetical protein [Devosia sp. ZB163]